MNFISKYWKLIPYALIGLYILAKYWLIPSYKPSEFICTDVSFYPSGQSAISIDEQQKFRDLLLGANVEADWFDSSIKLVPIKSNKDKSQTQDFAIFTQNPDYEDFFSANYGNRSYSLEIHRTLGLLRSITITTWQQSDYGSNNARHHSTVTLKPK